MRGYVIGAGLGCLYTTISRRPHANGVVRFSVGDPNSFSVLVVIGIVMAYHLFLTTTRRVKWVYVGFMMLGILAVFLTASRTGVAVLGLAGMIAVVDRRTLTPARAAGLAFAVLVMVIVVIQTVTSRQLGRIGTIGSATQSGLDQRTTYWRLAFDTFSQHPILGAGANAFREVTAVVVTGISRPAHNSFLGVAADLGIVGVVLFTVTLVSAWTKLPQLNRRLRQTWLAIGVAWFLGASTLTWEHVKITWFLAFLLAAEAAASRSRPTGRSPAETDPRILPGGKASVVGGAG
jgi:O-antigen ligase